ncbi:MAG: PQQ-binding-like beta-propeller repeat protein [Chloroherpetonaceae bacterium]|nr:PQQ-like beta-propeller repeat protein [Chthonomonadaceae bacterium]MDW8208787.1 PQQ-binding-like beta-propeller repeat protein [Chloroherpetonaceae bacterium]
MRRYAIFRTGMGAALAMVSVAAQAGDWLTWRGPLKNGITNETGWRWQWSGGAPRQLWSVQVGTGYSAVAVRGNRVYTAGNRGNRDFVYCLNADTGKTIWQYSYPVPSRDFPGDPYPAGTGASPVLDGNDLHILSREGVAFCLDANTGKLKWQRDLRRETRAQVPSWGFTGSALVDGNRIFYNVGSHGVALDRGSGAVLWKSGSGKAGYATPVLYQIGGQRGLAIFAGPGLIGVDPATGRKLWEFPWQTSYDVNAADPVIAGDTVFISSNYGKGGALLRLQGNRPSVVWQTRYMRNHFNASVLVNGFLYGNDENTLKCMDARNGNVRWQMRGMGKGGLIAADGKLLVMTERGELLVIAADPARFTEISRARVLNGTCWTHPVLANGRIYCRNAEGTLVCLDVRQ